MKKNDFARFPPPHDILSEYFLFRLECCIGNGKNSLYNLSLSRADRHTGTNTKPQNSTLFLKWRDINSLPVCGNHLVCIQQEIN